jgi:hypothetical protein
VARDTRRAVRDAADKTYLIARILARRRVPWEAAVSVSVLSPFTLPIDAPLRSVWRTVHSGERTVDVHVARLRQKLGLALIDTVRGVGYRLDADAELTVED